MWSLLLSVLVPLLHASEVFDNSLRESPEFKCGHGSIALNINTEHAAPSYVFVKGHFNEDGCSFKNTSNVTINFENCNVRRKREVNPKGMAYSMTLVVQLHPLFITKVDRAYNVKCFYQEAEKSVGTEMGVSDLTTLAIENQSKLPQCQYTLHKDSANGPLIKFANVGDVIYHVWDCASDIYAMLAHSCYALDGQGNQHRVIDEYGCSTDDYLMPELIYSKDLTKTFTASNAFNFPDQSSVYFNCQIKLCIKADGCDEISPPKCGTEQRLQRTRLESSNTTSENAEDVTQQSPVSNDVNNAVKQSLGAELDNDQLIANGEKGPATKVHTVVSENVGGSTMIIVTTTTELPITSAGTASTTRTSSRTTTTTTTSTTTTASPSTTTPPGTTTVVISKEAFPHPGALELSNKPKEPFPTPGTLREPFPKPNTLREFIEKKFNETEIVDEGSGLEITAEGGQERAAPIQILTGDPHNGEPRRDIRRRETPTTVDMDITSPELTILDKDYEMPEALKSVDPIHPATTTDQLQKNNVCIPLVGFWAITGIILVCLSVVTVAVCKAQAQRQKFIPY